MVHIRRIYLSLQVPKLASAAEYFFKMGVEGKRFRPTVMAMLLILLVDSSLDVLHWMTFGHRLFSVLI